MNKQNDKSVCLILFMLSSGATFLFFYLLFMFSYLILWIDIPTAVTLGFTIAVFLSVFGFILVKARRKRRRRLAAVSFGAVIVPSLLLVLMLTLPLIRTNKSPEQLPNRQQHLISPSGKYVLDVPVKPIKQNMLSFGHPFWQVTISDPNGNVIYQDKEKTFPGWFGTYWIWDELDRVWHYGSDVGTYYYENIDGQWIKHPWKKTSGIDPPELLYQRDARKKGSGLSFCIKKLGTAFDATLRSNLLRSTS